MKKLLFVVAMVLTLHAVKAQQKVGTVSYQRKTNTWKAIQNDEFRSRVPEFQINKCTLYFSDSLSMYKLIPDDNAPEPFGDGGGFRRFNFGGGDGDLYKNLITGLSTQANELGGKNFLIVDTIKKAPWKISAEVKQILGINCRKATRKVLQPVRQQRTFNFNNNNAPRDTTRPAPKEIEVVAWFAETILSPVGPDTYGQLPGVILELNIDDGTTIYTATEVKQTVDAKELKEPKKGKKVTRQEYVQLQKELFQNQGGGGGGNTIMRGGPGGQ